MSALAPLFFAFPVVLLTGHVIFRQWEKYCRLKKDVRVRIKHFNYAHFAFDKNLFPGHQPKAALESRDFVDMDRDLNFKAEMLHSKPAAYEDFLRIVNGMTEMGLCKHAMITYAALLAWTVIFLTSP